MKKILVVDDEPDVCFVLEELLSENGFVVDSFENPTLALEKFKSYSYDLVFLDIKMPELNGFALYRQIKRFNKKVKVCFITADEIYYDEYSDIFSSVPAKYVIRKPIENEELMKRINKSRRRYQQLSHIKATTSISFTIPPYTNLIFS